MTYVDFDVDVAVDDVDLYVDVNVDVGVDVDVDVGVDADLDAGDDVDLGVEVDVQVRKAYHDEPKTKTLPSGELQLFQNVRSKCFVNGL